MPLPPSILTPISGTTAYAISDDLVARYDVNDIGQWASDSKGGTAIPVPPTQLSTNPKVLAALSDGAGDIESALLMSDRYLPQDLAALTGNSLSRLKRLNCELAIGYLYERRLRRGEEPPPAPYLRGLETLERLRRGEWIFGFQEHGDAGVVAHQVEGSTDVERRNMVTFQAGRFFGRRSNRYDYTESASVAPAQTGGTGVIGQ